MVQISSTLAPVSRSVSRRPCISVIQASYRSIGLHAQPSNQRLAAPSARRQAASHGRGRCVACSELGSQCRPLASPVAQYARAVRLRAEKISYTRRPSARRMQAAVVPAALSCRRRNPILAHKSRSFDLAIMLSRKFCYASGCLTAFVVTCGEGGAR